MKDRFEQYRKEFSETKLIEKLNAVAKKVGMKTIYPVLLLYYAYKKKDTPGWAKKIITGAIGYFILPFDLVPDFLIPLIGYTDDLSVLTFGLLALTAHIDKTVIDQSRDKMTNLFGDYDTTDVDEIDKKVKDKQEENKKDES